VLGPNPAVHGCCSSISIFESIVWNPGASYPELDLMHFSSSSPGTCQGVVHIATEATYKPALYQGAVQIIPQPPDPSVASSRQHLLQVQHTDFRSFGQKTLNQRN